MKRQTKLIAILLITFMSIFHGFSQMDTLHLYYSGLQVKMADSTEAKITAWAKSLNGQRVDLNVVAYYSDSEFKKYSAERCDELFIILNRKARALINIVSNEPKKGKKFQRSTVDIIYKRTGASSAPEVKNNVANKSSESKNSNNKDQKTGNTVNNNGQKNDETKSANTSAEKVFNANDQFKTRKLMIVLLNESQDELDRLKEKPEELNTYRNNIKEHNTNITNAFKTNWKQSEVGFIQESELEKTNFEEKSKNWVLLLPGKSEIKNIPFMTYNVSMVHCEDNKCSISAGLIKVSLRSDMPDEGDFLVLMHKMKVFFGTEKEFDLNQLEETLAKKTLYVDAAMTEIGKDDFKDAYTFPYVFASAEEIKAKTKSGDKDAVYLKMDVHDGMINLILVNAENGAILARTQMSDITGPPVESFLPFKNNLNDTYSAITYAKCQYCATSGIDEIKNYIGKAKIKKSQVRDLAAEKKQIKYSVPLTIY